MTQRSTLNISLPPDMKAWIDRQIRAGQFGTASEFMRHLVRQAIAQSTRASIDDQLIEGLDSGRPTPMTRAGWAEIRREGRARIAKAIRKQPRPRRKSA